ncbi:MAG: hypothetical protein IT314_05750 [Anaerolineales bacterium]|nr:hypothetical protein [Anaerolineales bacterium]
MSQSIQIAAIRMNAVPASVEARLERAQSLIFRAAAQSAQLIVLPELFNSGYEYSSRNYQIAEPLDGQTLSWMKRTARAKSVHLAGRPIELHSRNRNDPAPVLAR